MTASLEELFWPKVDRDGPQPEWNPDLGNCWLWLAYIGPGGYGRFKPPGRRSPEVAHRVAYRLMVGPIDKGLDLDHLCRVRSCVNPGHLEPVTRQENLLRSPLMGGLNREKTHCANGHPYDEENTYFAASGRRNCRQCQRDRRAAFREANPLPPKVPKTHCKRGHLFDEANTRVGPDGRYCRACSAIRHQEDRRRPNEER